MQTHDGVRYICSIRISDALVIHGDQFDAVVKYAKWLPHLGNKDYTGLLPGDTWFNHVRRKLGFTYWSPIGLSEAPQAVTSNGVLRSSIRKRCSIATTAIGSNPAQL